MQRLDGKTLLVIGSGGIGGEIARRYASEGANVVLGDARLEAAADVVDAIGQLGQQATATRLDGADEASIAAAVELAHTAYGGLDGAHVNFATFADEGRNDEDLLSLPIADYDRTMNVDLRGYFLCARHIVPALLKRDGGSIVFTGSGGAYMGEPTRFAYAMSKLGIHALMRHIATRFGKQGVRSNCVSPGVTMHGNWEHLGEEFKDWAISLGRLPRLGSPADIAAMSALLMSDEGSYVTGQVICVDGGLTMRA